MGVYILSQPDLIYMNIAQWRGLQQVIESYKRIGKEISNAEAYTIWVQRGMPTVENSA